MMRPEIKRTLIVLLAISLLATAASAADPLRIAFIAYQNPDQLLENVEPVVEYLEATLGLEVESFSATDYAAVVEALAGGRADLGFMGPLQYVIARERSGAYPILGEVYNGSQTYVSRIFVRKDSKIADLAALRGKTMAFTDPISSSGYLYPLDAFKQKGLIESREDADRFFKKVYFAGGDEQALRSVLNGFVDAAGVGQFAFDLLRANEKDQIVSIGESRAIPSHCVVARRGLDTALVERFKKAMLALDKTKDRALLQKLYNVDGYVAVEDATYADVAEIAREYGFVRKGD